MLAAKDTPLAEKGTPAPSPLLPATPTFGPASPGATLRGDVSPGGTLRGEEMSIKEMSIKDGGRASSSEHDADEKTALRGQVAVLAATSLDEEVPPTPTTPTTPSALPPPATVAGGAQEAEMGKKKKRASFVPARWRRGAGGG